MHCSRCWRAAPVPTGKYTEMTKISIVPQGRIPIFNSLQSPFGTAIPELGLTGGIFLELGPTGFSDGTQSHLAPFMFSLVMMSLGFIESRAVHLAQSSRTKRASPGTLIHRDTFRRFNNSPSNPNFRFLWFLSRWLLRRERNKARELARTSREHQGQVQTSQSDPTTRAPEEDEAGAARMSEDRTELLGSHFPTLDWLGVRGGNQPEPSEMPAPRKTDWEAKSCSSACKALNQADGMLPSVLGHNKV